MFVCMSLESRIPKKDSTLSFRSLLQVPGLWFWSMARDRRRRLRPLQALANRLQPPALATIPRRQETPHRRRWGLPLERTTGSDLSGRPSLAQGGRLRREDVERSPGRSSQPHRPRGRLHPTDNAKRKTGRQGFETGGDVATMVHAKSGNVPLTNVFLILGFSVCNYCTWMQIQRFCTY